MNAEAGELAQLLRELNAVWEVPGLVPASGAHNHLSIQFKRIQCPLASEGNHMRNTKTQTDTDNKINKNFNYKPLCSLWKEKIKKW